MVIFAQVVFSRQARATHKDSPSPGVLQTPSPASPEHNRSEYLIPVGITKYQQYMRQIEYLAGADAPTFWGGQSQTTSMLA